MKITFKLNKQIITRSDNNRVVSNSIGYISAKFVDIHGDWIKPITAIFGDYSVILDDNNECIIPWEAIQKPGKMTVSAFCGNLHTANIETVEIEQSGYKQGETPKPPSDDVYNTLTQMAQSAIDTANSVRQDADSGKFDGTDGQNGADGKQGASVSAAKLDANGNLVFTVSDDTSSKDLPPINIDNANALKQINSAAETALSDIDNAKNDATNQINGLIAQAETAATKAEQSANSAQESATSAAQSAEAAEEAAQQVQNIIDDAAISKEKTWSSDKIVDYISDIKAPRYGVSGVGGSSTNLTRIWDSVGLSSMVGTDKVNQSYHNDFDSIKPFARKKCIGVWSKPDSNGKAHFTVNAYYGDPDYTEDGAKGDYVAVEVEPFYFYQDINAGIIGVSEGYHVGWSIHPVCLDENGIPREKTYLPCYNLAVDDSGNAVCLPGYFPSSGNYKGLRDIARTYRGGNTAAYLEPMAVRHYEWLLFTIEFATSNCQLIMQSAANLEYSNNARNQSTVASSGADGKNKFILSNSGAAKYVVGQVIAIGETSYSETYKRIITAIEVYDSENKTILFDGAALDIPVGWWVSSRPYKTGTCNTVTVPSGSPVSNSNGKYPCRYRYRESIWGNIFSTCNDLFADLSGTGTADDPYKIIWYLLDNPNYYPTSSSKPDIADFNSGDFKQLTQITEHVNGYIKKIATDINNPHCIVPVVQTGGSSNTYYADYGYFVNGTTGPRSVRLGGYLDAGANAGVLYFNAFYSVSHAYWSYGGGLYFRQ